MTPKKKSLVGRQRSGFVGGKATLKLHGREFFVRIGKKGGQGKREEPLHSQPPECQ